MMLVAVLGPRLIPDTTRSGRCSRSVPTASFTQSAGVPFTDRPTALPLSANSFTRSGVAVVIACPMAECSVSGATMLTAPSSRIAAMRACRPGEVTPSSLVTKMRGLGLLMRSPQESLPVFACFKDEFDDLVPRVDPRRAELEVGRICEHQGGQSRIAHRFDVRRSVFDVEIRSNLCFVSHETQIPVRNPVNVKPGDCLLDRLLVKVLDDEALSDREAVQLLVASKGPEVPFRQVIAHNFRELHEALTGPFRGDGPKSAVEVCAHAIKINAQNEPRGFSHHRLVSRSGCTGIRCRRS